MAVFILKDKLSGWTSHLVLKLDKKILDTSSLILFAILSILLLFLGQHFCLDRQVVKRPTQIKTRLKKMADVLSVQKKMVTVKNALV